MKRLSLILIIAIGILTPLVSTLLFYFSPPAKHTAIGEILPLAKTPAAWKLNNNKWTLLYANNAPCGEQCQKRLCQMRQLRLMLPGYYLKIQRAWLQNQPAPLPSITTSNDCGEARAANLAKTAKKVNITDGIIQIIGDIHALPSPATNFTRADYLYLIDPKGNIAMRFNPKLGAYEIRKDLAKLLKIDKGAKRTQNNSDENIY